MSSQTELNSICYKRNFIKEVIARVDLASPMPSLQNELPKTLSVAALKSFPIDEPKPAFTQELVLSQKALSTRKEEFTEWNFYGRNREKRLWIVPQSFFVDYNKYDKYETFRSEFIEVVNGFFSSFEQAQPSRFGLRYINQIEVPDSNPLDWNDLIDSQLLGLFSYKISDARPSRIFSNYEAVFADFNLRFQFGVYNPDYPAAIRRRVFVLDYDAYSQGMLDHNDIKDYLDKYHDAIQSLFERSITDNLREIMNTDV